MAKNNYFFPIEDYSVKVNSVNKILTQDAENLNNNL